MGMRNEHYKMYWSWRAQRALLDLVPLFDFDRFKRDHPRRFRSWSWSNYEKMLRECKLYKEGIGMIFLELDMKIRAEFRSTPLLAMVQ